jgi:hypothetical protein
MSSAFFVSLTVANLETPAIRKFKYFTLCGVCLKAVHNATKIFVAMKRQKNLVGGSVYATIRGNEYAPVNRFFHLNLTPSISNWAKILAPAGGWIEQFILAALPRLTIQRPCFNDRRASPADPS